LILAKCRKRDEAPKFQIEDVIMCFLVRAVAHIKGRAATDECRAIVE
jgi:hypothetical protein